MTPAPLTVQIIRSFTLGVGFLYEVPVGRRLPQRVDCQRLSLTPANESRPQTRISKFWALFFARFANKIR